MNDARRNNSTDLPLRLPFLRGGWRSHRSTPNAILRKDLWLMSSLR